MYAIRSYYARDIMTMQAVGDYAGAGFAIEDDEGIVGEHFDANDRLRVRQVNSYNFV